MKIHISMETKLLLDTLGRFHTEHRGMVEVKGKGMLDTYWLMGKEGGIARDDHDEDAESGAFEAGDTMSEEIGVQEGADLQLGSANMFPPPPSVFLGGGCPGRGCQG